MGKAIQIVKIKEDENHTCYLDEVALKRILNDERIRNKSVCVVLVGCY